MRAARWAPVAALALASAGAFALGLHRHVSLDALRQNRALLEQVVAADVLAAGLGFVAAYVLVVALSLPGASIMTLAGGFLFGWALGGGLSLVGAVIGATLVFLVARGALGDVLRRRAGPFLRRMQEGFHADAFNYLLFLRLAPVFPFWAVNLVPAFLGVPLGTFVAATAVGIVPGTLVVAALGAGLGELFDAGAEVTLATLFNPTLVAALVGLGLLALLPVAWRKWRAR